MKRILIKPAFTIPAIIIAIFLLVMALISCEGSTIAETNTTTETVFSTETFITTATDTVTATATTTATKTLEVNEAANTPEPAHFSVTQIEFMPIVPPVGSGFDAFVIVENTGDVEGTYDVVLYIETLGEFTQSVTIDAHTSKIAAFKIPYAPEQGTYIVRAGGITVNLYTG